MGSRAVTTTTTGGATVVALHGTIDAAAVRDLRNVLVDAIMRRPARPLVVDLTDADDLDATALGTLTAAEQAAADVGVAFTLRNPTPQVDEEWGPSG